GPSLATIGDREDGRGERRLRSARVRKADDVESLGGGGATQGHALPLSQSAQSPDSIGRGPTCTAEDRGADLYPGDPDQDGGALHAGRAARTAPRLGGNRGRRLHADLSALAVRPSADTSDGGTAARGSGLLRRVRAPAAAIPGRTVIESSWVTRSQCTNLGALPLPGGPEGRGTGDGASRSFGRR